jgi:hypothetical protein
MWQSPHHRSNLANPTHASMGVRLLEVGTVSGGNRHKDWNTRARVEHAAAADRFRGERARALLTAAQSRLKAATPRALGRPGVSTSTALRYATTSEPQRWIDADAGQPIIQAITDAAEDGHDRVIFPWPNRVGGAFVATALALQQARASGSLAHATFAYWPWRAGATWPARSVLVNPSDLLTSARRICNDISSGASWVDTSLAHEGRAVVELRFRELIEESSRTDRGSPDSVVVRSPNLFEITPVFQPRDNTLGRYMRESAHFLYRVRRHTRIGKLNLADRLATIDDPVRTPFGLFGLPAERHPEDIRPYLAHGRFAQRGLDVVVVDLTQLARQAFPETWENGFSALVAALDAAPGRRPPVAVVVEDAFALKVASRILRIHNAALSPRRSPPIDVGIYLPRRGPLGPSVPLPQDLPPVVFEPDIKDAALAPMRTRILSLGTSLREAGGVAAGDAASRALRFLRRTASLPIGIAEARNIADVLYPDENDADRAERSAFRPKMELADLYGVADRYPSLGLDAQRVAAEIEHRVESWSEETPVSAKLATLLNVDAKRTANTIIAVPSERIRDVLLSSERALNWASEVVAPADLAERLATVRPDNLVVVGPSPDVVRVLLTSPSVPSTVALIGDAAGIGLLKAEIWPIVHIAAFRPLADRAEALQAALARGGGDERLDLAEAAFRQNAPVVEREVDFTRAGDDYRGDIIHITTEQGGRFAYRPGSDVLVQSPGELRPFVRREARNIESGDLILALTDSVRNKLRLALFGTRRMREVLAPYHAYIGQARASLPGATNAEKSRHIVSAMKKIDSFVPDGEVHNVKRWITADMAECDADGYRMPGAARDWHRFHLFAQAIGMPGLLARNYWDAVVVRTRADRVQEGHGFNQQVVQFVLDPEAIALGAGALVKLPDLWQHVLNAVDSVVLATVEQRGGNGAHV